MLAGIRFCIVCRPCHFVDFFCHLENVNKGVQSYGTPDQSHSFLSSFFFQILTYYFLIYNIFVVLSPFTFVTTEKMILEENGLIKDRQHGFVKEI